MLDIINTNTEFGTSIYFDSYQFKEQLRNDFFLHSIDPTEPGTWEYKGKWYFNKTDLYIAILAHTAADQFGISDVVGLMAVLSGQAFIPTRAKLGGATEGTSFASKYLSKLPYKTSINLPMLTGYPKFIGGKGIRVAFTKILGRFLGRAIPVVGWGILAYDVTYIFYVTQLEFEQIVNHD